MKKQFGGFLLRWIANGVGLWVADLWLDSVKFSGGFWVIVGAGLVLSIVNALLKQLLVIFTLPAVLLSLGLFMIIINGVLVWLAGYFYGPLDVTNFLGAVLAGLVIGLVNYVITALIKD